MPKITKVSLNFLKLFRESVNFFSGHGVYSILISLCLCYGHKNAITGRPTFIVFLLNIINIQGGPKKRGHSVI